MFVCVCLHVFAWDEIDSNIPTEMKGKTCQNMLKKTHHQKIYLNEC